MRRRSAARSSSTEAADFSCSMALPVTSQSAFSFSHLGRSAGFFVSRSSRLMTRWSEPRPMEMPWAVSTVKPIMAS